MIIAALPDTVHGTAPQEVGYNGQGKGSDHGFAGINPGEGEMLIDNVYDDGQQEYSRDGFPSFIQQFHPLPGICYQLPQIWSAARNGISAPVPEGIDNGYRRLQIEADPHRCGQGYLPWQRGPIRSKMSSTALSPGKDQKNIYLPANMMHTNRKNFHSGQGQCSL